MSKIKEIIPYPKKCICTVGNDISDVLLSGVWITGVAIGLVNGSAVRVKRTVIGVKHISTALEPAEEHAELMNVESELRERVKELNCLYGISKLTLRNKGNPEEALQGIVNLIIHSWQYPMSTCARILLGGQEFKTGNFKETSWKLSSDIYAHGNRAGSVEVCYLKEKPRRDEGPFVKKERELINVIAKEIGKFIEQREAEEAMKKAYTAIETSLNATFTSDLEGKITYANAAAARMWRFENPADMVGTNVIDYWTEKSRGKAKEIVDILIKEGSYSGEGLIGKRKDGTEFLVETNSVILRDDSGKPAGMTGSFLDITEQKKAEEALKGSEVKFHKLFSTMADAAYLIGQKTGQVLDVNKVAETMYGYSREEWIKMKNTDVSAEPSETEKATQSLPDRIPVRYHKKKDGTVFPIEMSVGSYEMDGKKLIIATSRDITERKKAEETIKESEARYRTLFEGSADGILITDIETMKFNYANIAICDMLGYDEDEIKTKGVADIHPKEALEHVIDEFMNQASGEKTLVENIPCLKKDGTILYADINTRPLEINGRKCNVGFFRDITERKRAEEEKDVLEEQLRQAEKLRAVGELVGGVAHDFNNMLGAIIGYADLIAEDNSDEKGNEIDTILGKRINTITRASKRAADLIKKLLAFSRRGNYRNAPIDMHEVINDVLTLLEGSMDRKIIIKKKLTAADIIIKGDPSQVQNAILNMAINACDAMKNGGVLLISTRNENLEKGQYNAELEAGNYLVVSVSDTGKGMDEETKSRVFEPFFTTKGVGEGTGLGLASVYGTMKSHNGGVTVESRIGVGTRFRLYLPVIEQEDSNGEKESYRRIEKGQGTILVVDDEEMVRDMATDLLTECGYTVYTCRDGSEAVAWYKDYHSNTDLVILDIIMPVMDGVECYKKLKEINPDVKVILASGYFMDEKVQKLLEHGSLDFIEKPFSRVELAKLTAQKLKEKENSGIKVNEREHSKPQ